MENSKQCPVCGSKEIKQGKQHGEYARMYPINAKKSDFFIGGSDIISDICTECGHILSMKVAKPEKFK